MTGLPEHRYIPEGIRTSTGSELDFLQREIVQIVDYLQNQEKDMGSKKKMRLGRDARTGQFLPIAETERRPTTTVVETRRKVIVPEQAKWSGAKRKR